MEFGDLSAVPTDQGRPAPGAAPRGTPGEATKRDVKPDVNRAAPTAQPDPFASWYHKEPADPRGNAGSSYQPTQTVNSTPAKPAGYPPSGVTEGNPFTAANPFSSANPVIPPAPPFPPASPRPPAAMAGPPQRGGGRKGLFIVLAVIVVLAAGGGAYAVATKLGKHSNAQPPTTPTVSGSSSGSSPATGTQQASSPATSVSATQTPSPTLSLVAISPGVTASAAEPQVETLLSHYFHGINTHNYAEYAGTLNAQEQAKQPQSEFNSGYSSTTDSGMTLTGLTSNGNGLTATVTFTSRQSPAQSVDNSACNAWTLNLYLVPQGSGYLIGPAPSGYQPTYSNC